MSAKYQVQYRSDGPYHNPWFAAGPVMLKAGLIDHAKRHEKQWREGHFRALLIRDPIEVKLKFDTVVTVEESK